MEPIVDLAPGADSSILAPFFAERVRDNVKDPKRRAMFFSMKATLFVVDFDSGQATTLRFDHGRLTLHDGAIGLPSVTIGGPLRALMSLDRIRLRELPAALVGRSPSVSLVDGVGARGSSPPPSGPSSSRSQRADLAELVRLFARGEVKVYGYLAHPRTIVRFLRLIARERT